MDWSRVESWKVKDEEVLFYDKNGTVLARSNIDGVIGLYLEVMKMLRIMEEIYEKIN